MASMTTTTKRIKPSRTCGFKAGVLTMVITTGTKIVTDRYSVSPLPCDFGRAFRMTKLDGAADGIPYDLSLSKHSDTCECLGHLKWGHCRHVESLRALLAAGKV